MSGPDAASIPGRARELAVLADVLLPGDDLFPAASEVGAHGLLAERLRERLGARSVAEVLDALVTAAEGSSLGDLEREERIAAVRRFEAEAPGLFATVRSTLYFSYYQSPLVVAAIRALGIAYNDAPQPHGYEMAPFDPTPGKDAPAHPRGSYNATSEIAPIAASAGGAGIPPLPAPTGEGVRG
jgi:hypothetical protein